MKTKGEILIKATEVLSKKLPVSKKIPCFLCGKENYSSLRIRRHNKILKKYISVCRYGCSKSDQ